MSVMNKKSSHIIPPETSVKPVERERRNGHKGAVLWFTGLSGSGKSTLTQLLDRELFKRGVNSYVLDGDRVRTGLNSDLGFSKEDREENIRRIAEVAALFADSGAIVSTAFISPYRKERDFARSRVPAGQFLEIFVDTPLDECERRDVKGLYKKARAGEIKGFTGIDDTYEAPENPELRIETVKMTPREAVIYIIQELQNRSIIINS